MGKQRTPLLTVAPNPMTTYTNDDLFPLISQAIDAFKAGDRLKTSALRAKVNIRLRKRGEDPMEFWTNFLQAAQTYQALAN